MALTLQQAITRANERLSPSATARRDAELLLLHLTGLTRTHLLTHPEDPLTAEQSRAYEAAVDRRANHEPIQYITGVQEFYGRPFRVTRAVLIPRPETEHLVEAALTLPTGTPPGAPRILDIGTGSGILAITLALLFVNATVTATDISAAALTVAQENAADHGVANRIRFLQTDLLAGLDGESFGLIVSNPPYVPEHEPLEPQVARYEPHPALFAGPDGLALYRRLIPTAAAALLPGGHLLLEIGHGQASAVQELLSGAHLSSIQFVPDLQGIPRIAVARKPFR